MKVEPAAASRKENIQARYIAQLPSILFSTKQASEMYCGSDKYKKVHFHVLALICRKMSAPGVTMDEIFSCKFYN